MRVPDTARGQRLDRFLSAELGYTRAVIQRWIKQGLVTLDDAELESAHLVVPGSAIVVRPTPPLPSRAEPDASVTIDCVFEDEHLIVVNKPPGLVVHPGKGNWTRTLVNGLLARSQSQLPVDGRDPEGQLRPGIVHRIDKDTSGLLVVAKTERARNGLMEQLAAHTMQRSYLALTAGVPESGRIETSFGRHPTNRLKFSSRVRVGKPAITHVDVVERFGDMAALVRCRLETGRTHQIRVHLSECHGAPILADTLYGRSPRAPLRSIAALLGRQALHAAELGFEHPLSGRSLHFEIAFPADMESALARLRAERANAKRACQPI